MAYLLCDESERPHQNFLAASEQRLVERVLSALPPSVTPLRLTKIGVFGAVVAAAALIGCRWSPAWLSVLMAGILLNWFGMTLDGPLARRRNVISPRLEVIGQTNDLLSQALVIVMFGASPFLSFRSAFVVLACYLLFSAYNYVRTIAQRARPMAYIGLGPTEFRILMVAWPLVAQAFGVDETAHEGHSRLDTTIMILAAFSFIGLAGKAIADARQLAAEE